MSSSSEKPYEKPDESLLSKFKSYLVKHFNSVVDNNKIKKYSNGKKNSINKKTKERFDKFIDNFMNDRTDEEKLNVVKEQGVILWRSITRQQEFVEVYNNKIETAKIFEDYSDAYFYRNLLQFTSDIIINRTIIFLYDSYNPMTINEKGIREFLESIQTSIQSEQSTQPTSDNSPNTGEDDYRKNFLRTVKTFADKEIRAIAIKQKKKFLNFTRDKGDKEETEDTEEIKEIKYQKEKLLYLSNELLTYENRLTILIACVVINKRDCNLKKEVYDEEMQQVFGHYIPDYVFGQFIDILKKLYNKNPKVNAAAKTFEQNYNNLHGKGRTLFDHPYPYHEKYGRDSSDGRQNPYYLSEDDKYPNSGGKRSSRRKSKKSKKSKKPKKKSLKRRRRTPKK